jgi:hypothetical protein
VNAVQTTIPHRGQHGAVGACSVLMLKSEDPIWIPVFVDAGKQLRIDARILLAPGPATRRIRIG